jgi:hypothetical protein
MLIREATASQLAHLTVGRTTVIIVWAPSPPGPTEKAQRCRGRQKRSTVPLRSVSTKLREAFVSVSQLLSMLSVAVIRSESPNPACTL